MYDYVVEINVDNTVSTSNLDYFAEIVEVFTGAAGDSAYQVALRHGFVGTEQQWLDSLVHTASPVDVETIRDTIGSTLVAGSLINLTVNDAADTVTITSTATQNSSDAILLSRANHTGTQLAATISDLTEVMQDMISSFLVAGAGMAISYNDAGNQLTLTSTGGAGGAVDQEGVRDTIATALRSSGNITVTVDDAGDTITIGSTATANASDATLLNRANHTGTQLSGTISDFAEASQDVIAAALVAGSGMTITYDDAGNTITLAAAGGGTLDTESVQDIVGALISGSGVITATYNDAANTLVISSTATTNSPDATLLNRTNHTGTQAISTVTSLQTTLDSKPTKTTGGFISIADMAPYTVKVVMKDPVTGFWPAGWTVDGAPIYTGGSGTAGVRPTSRGDIVCDWVGPDPDPPIVTTGTAGMRDGIDRRGKTAS